MNEQFSYSILGNTGLRVFRMGLSATYRPGKDVIHRALDAGVNVLFGYGFDTQMTGVLRDRLRTDRDSYVVITGAYNYIWSHQNVRRTVEKRLRQLGTDHIDVFLFLGVMKENQFTERARDDLYRCREEGKVRFIGVSSHDRQFAGKLARDGILDVLMIRYNAAHRGAERDIFPQLATHNPGVMSYTATRWRELLRRPRSWPKDGFLPTAAQCYRFVLSHPSVHICLTAPSNRKQLEANLKALEDGPLTEEELADMQRFGDAVHDAKHWFM
jgi:aryl-alcohol dehydrogenase-like predicted oxidoreductase